jgi:hypothetical protein
LHVKISLALGIVVAAGAALALHHRASPPPRAPELGSARTAVGLRLLAEAKASLPRIQARLAEGEERLAAGDRGGAWRGALEAERLLEPLYLAELVPIPDELASARAALDRLAARIDPRRTHFFDEELARRREHIAEELSDD